MNAIQKYKKCLWAIPLAILLNIDCLRPEVDGELDGDLNFFFLNSFFDVRNYDSAGETVLLLSFMSMSAILIFAMICGMDIYKEMYSSGIYVITRVKSKKKWTLSLVTRLAKKTLLFSILYAIITWILEQYYTGMEMDEKSIFAFLLAVSFLFLTVFIIALSINYISIRNNTRIGVFSGASIMLVMILYVLFYDKIPVLGDVYYLRYLDPVYICNLFYEKSVGKTILISFYYLLIIVCASFCFINKVDKLDIKLLNEDI